MGDWSKTVDQILGLGVVVFWLNKRPEIRVWGQGLDTRKIS